MLKLYRIDGPTKLFENKETETEKFILGGKNVWNKQYIKDALMLMSNNKCVYCETKLDNPGIYVEVEHFYHKNKYKEKVLEWTNLLPACKRCNGTKNDHDVGIEPIINPCEDNPQEHLYLKRYRFRDKDILGKSTIDVLNLNERDKLVKARFEIGNKVLEKLEELSDQVQENISGISSVKRKYINKVKALLREGQADQEYSVVVSTIILEDDKYFFIKKIFIENDLWDEEFKKLEIGMENIYLYEE